MFERTSGGGIETYPLYLFWLIDHCSVLTDWQIRKTYEILEESNGERKCYADVLNEGEHDFYIQGLGLRIYDLGLGFEVLNSLS